MLTKATKPVSIEADLYNELLSVLRGLNVTGADRLLSEKVADSLEAVILMDDCIDGDGSGLCETHSYLPMEYFLDVKGNVLKRGTFDPEEEGFPVCPDSQKYDESLADTYSR